MSHAIETGTDELLCEVRERVAILTLNRPQARNALSVPLSAALRATIPRLRDDPEVGSILITGAGRAFCAGGDVKRMGAAATAERSFEERVADLRERQRQLTGTLVAIRKPTIAALPGPAIGVGLALALACDLRVGADSAYVNAGYARIALSGDYGIAWLLTRLLGSGRAREMMLLSENLDARRCESLGLFNRVVADDRLQDEAFAIARGLANGPAIALGLIKDNLDDAPSLTYEAALDREADRLMRAAATEDHQEAVRAFVEKRAPRFSGR